MINRRLFTLGMVTTAATSVAACAPKPSATPPTAEASRAPAPGPSVHSSFGSPVKQIDAGELNIGYFEVGPTTGTPMILLHGWPYDPYAYVDVAPILADAGYRVIVPFLRGYGSTVFRSPTTFRNGQQSVLGVDVIALMDALNIPQAVLGGYDWGSRTAAIVAALWPARVKALVAVSGYLIVNRTTNLQPLTPQAELGWWYQYYFATERGVLGYSRYRHDFNKLIWKTASPRWRFDDATYDRSAPAFDNPDHVAIVVHNYRWRLSLAAGDPRYDDLENRLAAGPVISVPTITVSSDFDGAAADGSSYRPKFSGRYDHRVLSGIGHDVPQEAPQEFAKAMIDATHI